MKKVLSILLCLIMVAQTFCFGTLFAGATESTSDCDAIFEDSFDYESFSDNAIYDSSKAWVKEYRDRAEDSDDYGHFDSTPPHVENGVLKFDVGDGIRFNWQKLQGFETFDETKTYIFNFDVKVTDFGDDYPYTEDQYACNREFYFGVGGYYNQIEFRNANKGAGKETIGIRAGDTWGNVATLNKVYSCTVEWCPSEKKITTTVKDGDSTVATGSRTSSTYETLNKYTRSFVWRCEDGTIEVDNLTFSDGTNTYEQDFYLAEKAMTSSAVWALENVQMTDSLEPTFENGVLKLGEKSGVRFNWTDVSNIGAYDSSKIYTFEFDAKLTDAGDGSYWGKEGYTRALYVGFGGWYTLVELPNSYNNVVMATNSTDPYTADKYLNKDFRVKLVWEGKTLSASIADDEGNILIQGSRTGDDFVNMTVKEVTTGITDAPMKYLVLRCEDGAVEIDNFKFGIFGKVSTTSLNIGSDQQAVYECDINYTAGSNTLIKLGSSTVFSISNNNMSICTREIQGSYGTGIYKLKLYINPQQEMVSAEVIKPDGGVVRRGLYTLLGGTAINVYSTNASNISNEKIEYTDITMNEYTLTDTEPAATGVEANIYNVVTSFDNACTTRNFAWTAKNSFIGSEKMAVKYRKSGNTDWKVAEAEKETELYEVSDEEYFKCDITGLIANTSYEYKIGKRDSSDETNDWSKTYTFKTSAVNIDEFSFVAVGDTQGITWGGDTVSDKGFKYAKAAFEEAFEEISDPAFILHAGDVVEWGGNKNMWNWYFKSLGDYGASIPHFATIGNHDTWRESTENLFFDYHFNHPNNGGINALNQIEIAKLTDTTLQYVAQNADETIYSYNYGKAHVVVLNTGGYKDEDVHIIEAQRQWLINDLEANRDAQWTIMLIHQPVYHRTGGSYDRTYLYDVIEGYGIDLVIQGHSHLFTRSYPMKDGQIVTKELTDVIPKGTGTIYTTIGSTALNHDGLTDTTNVEEMFSLTIPQSTQPAYTTVKVDGEKLVVTIKQVNGLVLDTFTIEGEAQEEAVVGDITGNGNVDAQDLTVLCVKLINNNKYDTLYDVNEDGYFDIRDLVRLKKICVESI